jgi:hypothetical protein
LSAEEGEEFWLNLYHEMGGKGTIGDARSYYKLGDGVNSAVEIAKGLGALGVKAYTKTINGKDWVIIKDFRKHQQTLMKGSKWGANNPRVVQMGLGLNDIKGAARFVKFYAGIELAFAVGINAADYIIRDEATLVEFVGNSAGDMVKGVVSLVGAGVVTSMFVPVTAGFLATTILFAFASFFIGEGLTYIDQNNGYSEDMTNAIKELMK